MGEADRAGAGIRAPRLALDRPQWLVIGIFAVITAIGCRDMHLNADSLHYIDMARTLIEDHTLATWDLTLTAQHVPKIESLWPPMYAVLLAGPMALGFSGQAAAAIVAVVSLTGILALLMMVARRIEWGILLGLLLTYMTFRHGIAFRAFSETPFMALSFAALIVMALSLQAPPPGSWRSRGVFLALLAGSLAAMAALTRHIGFMLIPSLGLMALFAPLSSEEHRLKTRLATLAAAAVGAGLPLVTWFARYSAAGVSYFGPDRPPSPYTIAELFSRAANGIYIDAMLPLLVIAACVLGYHLSRDDDASGWRPFVLTLAIGATLFAIFHEAGTIASHATIRMDNPPEGRQFFPGYAVLLLIAAALISLARPPESLRGWRWAIVAVVALPVLGGPLVAASRAHDLTPVFSEVDRWVQSNTGRDDLVIGWRAWSVRYYTGRPVLQSGMVTEPSVYDGPAVAEFLERFGSKFTGAWLLVPVGRPDADQAVRSYEDAGLHLEEVAELDVSGVYHYRGIETILVYRVSGWQNR